jgi:tRNA threonylcarbamoyladenosine biosynthesis protein TsaE
MIPRSDPLDPGLSGTTGGNALPCARTLLSCSPEDTENLGRITALHAFPGLRLLLQGPLGAGKSVFARGFATALGAGRVRSPSFGLVHELRTHPPVAHCDLYRLEAAEQVEDLGLDEYAENGWILLVEWADRRKDWGEGETLLFLFEDPIGTALSEDVDPVPRDSNRRTLRCFARGARAESALEALIRTREAFS